ncbi:MAG: amidohydrolase family protein [Acidimicrobiia bacterium]|nr:amidohydrolase family protein [Acidimicrobiia bacterium]
MTHLGERGLTYDTWQYHTQIDELPRPGAGGSRHDGGARPPLDAARGRSAGPAATTRCSRSGSRASSRWRSVRTSWRSSVAWPCPTTASSPSRTRTVPMSPRSSPRRSAWYLHALECFGPDRGMFESNFPVDKLCVDYPVIWEAFERIAERCTSDEQDALFAGTARSVYRLG